MIAFPIHTTSMSLRSGLELLFCLNQTVSPAAHKADEFRAQSQHPSLVLQCNPTEHIPLAKPHYRSKRTGTLPLTFVPMQLIRQ